MSDFPTCFSFVESNEDPANLHKQVSDSCPEGCSPPCYAISGINSGAWPTQFAAIAAIPQADRGAAVQSFYQAEFWGKWDAQVTSDEVMKRWLDMAVNTNPRTSTKLLQGAVNAAKPDSPPIAVDGAWGPATVAAVNAVDVGLLVAAFQSLRYAHYQEHDASNPYLAQLLARAMK